MNCSLKYHRHEYHPNCCVHIEVFHILCRFFDRVTFIRSRRLSPCEAYCLVIFWNDVAKFDFWVLDLLNLLEFWICFNILGVQSSPLPQVSLCLWTVEHPFAILWELDAVSGLEFFFAFTSSLPDNPTYRLETVSTPGFSTQSDGSQMNNLQQQNWSGSSPLVWISPQSCFPLIVLASFSPSFRCSWSSWNP